MSQNNSKAQKAFQQEFFPNNLHNYKLPVRQRAKDKQRVIVQKFKKDQIQSCNNFLQQQTNKIDSRSSFSLPKTFIQPIQHQLKRYNGFLKNKRMQSKQSLGQNEREQIVIPGVKNRRQFMEYKTKSSNFIGTKTQTNNYQFNNMKIKKKVYSSNSQNRVKANVTFNQRQLTRLHNKKEKLIFNEPQKNQKRQVLYKRTIILSTNQSCLLELSLLQNRMLIVAYLMGIQNKLIKQILSVKRTQKIIKQYQNKLDQFCSKISLERINNQYQIIKISSNNSHFISKEESSNEDKTKEKVRVQRQFLKRNYYNLYKYQQDGVLKNKDLGTISNRKAQDMVQRLVGNSRYLIKAKQKQSQIQKVQKQQKFFQQSLQSRININFSEDKFTQRKSISKVPLQSTVPSQIKQNSIKKSSQNKEEKKIKISLKRTDSMDFQKESIRDSRNSQVDNFILESGTKNIKTNDILKVVDKEQESVEDLDNVQQLLEFQNSSAFLESLKKKNAQELLISTTKKIESIKNQTIQIKEQLIKQQSLSCS